MYGAREVGKATAVSGMQEGPPTLLAVLEAFLWIRESSPVYTTMPVIDPVFFRVHPRSSISSIVTGICLPAAANVALSLA